jgi:hypothetical protein
MPPDVTCNQIVKAAFCPMGTGTYPLGLNLQGREADRSLLTSAKVKKIGAIPPLPTMSSWRIG